VQAILANEKQRLRFALARLCSGPTALRRRKKAFPEELFSTKGTQLGHHTESKKQKMLYKQILCRNREHALKGNAHGIILAKGLRTKWTFPGAALYALFDAFFAKNVATVFDNGVFQVFLAHLAIRYNLLCFLSAGNDVKMQNASVAYAKALLFFTLIAQSFLPPRI